MSALNPFDSTLTVAGKHKPDCDSQLGPDFEVDSGEVRMTIHVCFGCLPVFEEDDA